MKTIQEIEVFEMSKKNETNFLYAVAKIKAIENRLLDKSKIERMLDAYTPEDALKVITEADYGYSVSEVSDAHIYEVLLEEEMQKTIKLLSDISPQKEIFDIFMQKNDYHNVKVLLKAEFLGIEKDENLVETGAIELRKMKMSVKERSFIDFPPILRQAINDSLDTFGRTNDPQSIDLILDQACYKQMLESAKSLNNDFVTGLVKALIDTVNIKMFMRLRALKKNWDFAQRVLLKGGSIDTDVYINNLESPVDSVIELLRYTSYGNVCESGIEDFKNTGSVAALEKLCDNYIMGYVKKAKYLSMGMAPLIAYYVAKETEIKNVRIVMTGKINKLPNEQIKERLRDLYV